MAQIKMTDGTRSLPVEGRGFYAAPLIMSNAQPQLLKALDWTPMIPTHASATSALRGSQ